MVSQRGYPKLSDFWRMVARSAYTELNYSLPRLLLCTALMVLMFLLPVVALLQSGWVVAAGVAALLFMVLSFVPMVRFCGLAWPWAITLPVAAALFLGMTWSSAWSYWRGTRALWKNRAYGVAE